VPLLSYDVEACGETGGELVRSSFSCFLSSAPYLSCCRIFVSVLHEQAREEKSQYSFKRNMNNFPHYIWEVLLSPGISQSM